MGIPNLQKCPLCQGKLIKGKIAFNDHLLWLTPEQSTYWTLFGGELLAGNYMFRWRYGRTALRCEVCDLIIFYPDD